MKKDRRRLDELYADRFKLWQKLLEVADFIRGSVVILHRPCNYPNCRLCKEGKRHAGTYLSQSKKGKTQLTYLPKRVRPKAEEWVENYRQIKDLLEEISDTNVQILRLLSKGVLQKGRRKE